MPTVKEFTISLEDKPGTLGKLCQALADQNVKILAFQSFPLEKGKSSVHLVLNFETHSSSSGAGASRVATRRSGNQHRLRVLRSRAWHQCNVPDLRGRGGG